MWRLRQCANNREGAEIGAATESFMDKWSLGQHTGPFFPLLMWPSYWRNMCLVTSNTLPLQQGVQGCYFCFQETHEKEISTPVIRKERNSSCAKNGLRPLARNCSLSAERLNAYPSQTLPGFLSPLETLLTGLCLSLSPPTPGEECSILKLPFEAGLSGSLL